MPATIAMGLDKFIVQAAKQTAKQEVKKGISEITEITNSVNEQIVFDRN